MALVTITNNIGNQRVINKEFYIQILTFISTDSKDS